MYHDIFTPGKLFLHLIFILILIEKNVLHVISYSYLLTSYHQSCKQLPNAANILEVCPDLVLVNQGNITHIKCICSLPRGQQVPDEVVRRFRQFSILCNLVNIYDNYNFKDT